MAVDYGMSIGFESSQLIQALLITQFVGFPAAIAFGKIGQKFGPKTGIYIALVIYTSVTVYAYFMTKALDFYVLAVCIGLVQGGIQSLSRSLFAELIPQQQATEYFGFFNMAGKFAAVLGPFVVGSMNKLTGDPRVSILSLIPFFVIGGTILYFVDIKEGRLAAKEL
jgi:UMF1 family MFS transporter